MYLVGSFNCIHLWLVGHHLGLELLHSSKLVLERRWHKSPQSQLQEWMQEHQLNANLQLASMLPMPCMLRSARAVCFSSMKAPRSLAFPANSRRSCSFCCCFCSSASRAASRAGTASRTLHHFSYTSYSTQQNLNYATSPCMHVYWCSI